MTLVHDLLREHSEPIPSWLAGFRLGARFDRTAFLSSRVAYYPGYGDDGQLVKIFGSAHAAHCFVLADTEVSTSMILERLEDPSQRFKGYRSLMTQRLRVEDLAPVGWTAHVTAAEARGARGHQGQGQGVFVALERQDGFGPKHGPARLAVVFLCADGIATYDALFCQGGVSSAPYAALLQDHGFGGNYDRFGAGGLMERIAARAGQLPRWLLVGANTRPWEGYVEVEGLSAVTGGMHASVRRLWVLGRAELSPRLKPDL